MIISEIMSNALFIQRVLTTLFLQNSSSNLLPVKRVVLDLGHQANGANHNVLVFLASIDEIVFRWMDDI